VHRCFPSADARYGFGTLVLERAIATSGPTPRRVITDKAGTYPLALAVAVPGVLHRSGRYRTNGIERDHAFLKKRLRPMRGLKSDSSAAIFMRGHALMRNTTAEQYSRRTPPHHGPAATTPR
jgi:transposase-like protein